MSEIIQKFISKTKFPPADSFGPVIHFQWTEHNETATELQDMAPSIHQKIQDLYPDCRVESKEWPAPNNEYNLRISVYS